MVLVLVLLVLPATVRAQNEEVMKFVPPERIEKIFEDLKQTYKKAPLASAKNSFTYDYDRNSYKLRLYYYAGQDLMIDAEMAKADWETVNKWNSTAKFSRASLRKDKLGEFVTLESNLDCIGGVTEGTIKQFMRQFDEEVRNWQLAALGPPKEEETYKVVSEAQLEKILEGLKYTVKKSMNVNGTATFFDFESKGYKMRLTSFGGKDLMIDVIFKKSDLDTINKWNVKRNFIRAVLYSGNPDYTSLEANLDCSGGVSESIVRYFINTFNEEARQFDKYLNGN